MDKLLKIYTYVDGVNDTPFPNADAQIEIFSFNYNAKRMGSAPTISASAMYKECLDDKWTGKEYVLFRGEKFTLKQTPTSSKDNTDERYKHDLELVSSRDELDNTTFRASLRNSYSAEVVFFGDLKMFVEQLRVALENVFGEKYTVIIDDENISTEAKLVKFSKFTITKALQEAYKLFEIPYYFVGNVLHFGFGVEPIDKIFEYGRDNQLLSITKNNSNKAIVNRCTGTGSDENIQYFYPNEHPVGEITPLYKDDEDNNLSSNLNIADEAKFSTNTKLSTVLTAKDDAVAPIAEHVKYYNVESYNSWKNTGGALGHVRQRIGIFDWYLTPLNAERRLLEVEATDNVTLNEGYITYPPELGGYKDINTETEKISFSKNNTEVALMYSINTDGVSSFDINLSLSNDVGSVTDVFTVKHYMVLEPRYNASRLDGYEFGDIKYFDVKEINGGVWERDESLRNFHGVFLSIVTISLQPNYSMLFDVDIKLEGVTQDETINWHNEENAIVSLEDYGLEYDDTIKAGDTITFYQTAEQIAARLDFKDTLMPSIYRKSKGMRIFYPAKNYPFERSADYELDEAAGEYIGESDGMVHNDLYKNPETGKYYEFKNEYNGTFQREHAEEFDDVKPSIINFRNKVLFPINVFEDIAYDKNDNDDVGEDGEYVHPNFFVKLRKTDGKNSFNLFNQAIENGEMAFSMTSGDCGACKFTVVVDKETKKNIVQVYTEGTLVGEKYYAAGELKRDENGNVVLGAAQDVQNNTAENNVWIALKKDNSTYPHIMPNATFGLKPKAFNPLVGENGDTFVITNMVMPKAFILEAEEELSRQIIKYMYEHNRETFAFSIRFSRIFLAENPNILTQLNESASLHIKYNNIVYTINIDSFSYKMRGGEVLPEVIIELNESIVSSRNVLEAALDKAKKDAILQVEEMDISALVAENFLQKNVEDTAAKKINFRQGWSVGVDNKSDVDEYGNSKFNSVLVKDSIGTEDFSDGFSGAGFKLWKDASGKTKLTVDDLTIRETFRVFEMLVTKIRAVNGGLFISAANGVIANVEFSEEVVDTLYTAYYYITLEDHNMFIEGDYMRCQVFSGSELASWWVEVHSVDGLTVKVKAAEFEGQTPKAGQDVVLCGSKNPKRQNAISISATEDGQPRIEILNGINKKTLEGCLRTRLGNLDGIDDSYFGENQPHGDGLYSDNVYLKGEFLLKNSGKDVETLFSIQDGKITGMVEQTTSMSGMGQTYLYNASFAKGLDGWITEATGTALLLGGNYIRLGGNILANGVNVSSEPISDGKYYVKINNSWLKQSQSRFVGFPKVEKKADAKIPLYFSVYVRCIMEGTLIVKAGETKIYEEEIGYNSDFVLIKNDNATWNGIGDFYIEFTNKDGNAEADFYGFTLFSDRAELTHFTLFEQTATLIGLSAGAKDSEGNIVSIAALKITVDGFRTDVQSYEAAVDNYGNAVNGYKEQVSSFSQTVDGFNATVERFQGSVDDLGEEIDTIEVNVSSVSQKADSINQRVSQYETKNLIYNGQFDGYTDGWIGAHVSVKEDKKNLTNWLRSDQNNAVFAQSYHNFKNTENILPNASVAANKPYGCKLSFQYRNTTGKTTNLFFYKDINDSSTGNAFDTYERFAGQAVITDGVIKARAGVYAITIQLSETPENKSYFYIYGNTDTDKKVYLAGEASPISVTNILVEHKDSVENFNSLPKIFYNATSFALDTTEENEVKLATVDLAYYGEIFHYVYFSIDAAEVDITNIQLVPTGSNLPMLYETHFEQTAKLMKLSAKNFNSDGTVSKESGLVIMPESSGLFTKDNNGNVATIGTYEDGIVKLSGNEIRLEGAVTANGNVSISTDGKLTAKDGVFTGEIQATSGKIGKFAIQKEEDGGGLIYSAENYTAVFDSDKLQFTQNFAYNGVTQNKREFIVSGAGDTAFSEIVKIRRVTNYLDANDANRGYTPIATIEGEGNAFVALRTKGAIDCIGGIYERASFLNIVDGTSANVVNIIDSCVCVVKSSRADNQVVYLPKESTVRATLQLGESQPFALPVEIHCHKSSNSLDIYLADENGGAKTDGIVNAGGSAINSLNMSKGDTARFLLIHDGTSYYAQWVGSLS